MALDNGSLSNMQVFYVLLECRKEIENTMRLKGYSELLLRNIK